MNKLRGLSLFLAILGCCILAVSQAYPVELAQWQWLPLSGGLTVLGGWLILWKCTGTKNDGMSESESLMQLRQDIELEAAKLEKERARLRRAGVTQFSLEESSNLSEEQSLVDVRGGPTDWESLDAKVMVMMREESERLFSNLLDNTYMVDGVFDRSRLGDDLIGLMESIARVYKPDSEHPLLETSVERLLRAVNHASVQMLVHLQQLPLDVKSYNLRETYRYVRSGAKYYGYYKKVEPYWTYARPVYHLGRLAMGANPITIGVGWAVSEMIKHGSVNYAHSYALRLLHDTVRIIGNEAAGIFGGDYRHRDPAWVYGLEIVTLSRTFPESRARLEATLGEVAGLSLASEYDRVFLYSCLSGRAIARPERFAGRDFLSLGERQQIAQRLEQHLQKHGMDKDVTELKQWKPEIEERLGVHLRVGKGEIGPTEEQATRNALRALVSFLIQFKGMECDTLRPLLLETATGDNAGEIAFDQHWQSIQSEPPMLYEIPYLGTGTAAMDRFLEDLLLIEASHAPRFPESAEAIEETAGYFREDSSKWRAKLRSCYAQYLFQGLDSAAGSAKNFPDTAAPLLLGLLDEGEFMAGFYQKVSFESEELLEQVVNRDLVLCLTNRRLLLIAAGGGEPGLIWRAGRGEISVDRVKGIVTDDCRIVGGRWFLDSESPPLAIIVAGKKLGSYQKHFASLIDWVGDEQPISS